MQPFISLVVTPQAIKGELIKNFEKKLKIRLDKLKKLWYIKKSLFCSCWWAADLMKAIADDKKTSKKVENLTWKQFESVLY